MRATRGIVNSICVALVLDAILAAVVIAVIDAV
jgi:hypothetical protein